MVEPRFRASAPQTARGSIRTPVAPQPRFGPATQAEAAETLQKDIQFRTATAKKKQRKEREKALIEGGVQQAILAGPQNFGDLIFNKIPVVSPYLKKTAEASEKYHKIRDQIPPEFQNQYQGQGILHQVLESTGKNVLEMGLDLNEFFNAAIPINDYKKVKDVMNQARRNYGLVDEAELAVEEAVSTRLQELEGMGDDAVSMAGNLIHSFKKGTMTLNEWAREPNPKKKKEMGEQMSFDFVSALGNFAGLGSKIQQMFGVSSDGEFMYVKGIPVSELEDVEKSVSGDTQIFGSLINSVALWSKVSPWVGKDVLKTVPGLKEVAVKHPVLFQGIITNAAEEMTQAVASNIVGVEYNFGDTVFGMATQFAFTTAQAGRAAIKGEVFDPMGLRTGEAPDWVKDINHTKAAVQADNAMRSFVEETGRSPSNIELQEMLGDTTIPGTRQTWNDLHEYSAQRFGNTFGERRLAGLKDAEPEAPKSDAEGKPPVDITKANKPDIEAQIESFRKAGAGVQGLEVPIDQIKPVGEIRGEGVEIKPGETVPPPVGIFDAETGKIELIDGNRRFAELEAQGFKEIPVKVIDPLNKLAEGQFRAAKAPEIPKAPTPKEPRFAQPADVAPRRFEIGESAKSRFAEEQVPGEPIQQVPKTPEEAKQVLDSVPRVQSVKGQVATAARTAKREARRFVPKKVKQVFKTKRFQLDEKGLDNLKQVQKSLGLTERDVRSWKEVEEVAEQLGRDPIEFVKRTANNRPLTDAEIQALSNTIKTASDYLSRKYELINKRPDMEEEILQKADQYERLLNEATQKLVGGGTELGRGVNIYRNIAKNKMDDPTYWLKEAQKLIGARKKIRVVEPGRVFGKKIKVEEGKFPEELREAIEDLRGRGDQIGLSYLMSHLRESNNWEKAVTLWKAGLLTAPTTQFANALGNTTMAGLETTKDIPATVLDILISPITGERKKAFTFRKIRAQGQGFIEGTVKAGKFIKTGIDPEFTLDKWDIYKDVHYNSAIAEVYTQTVFRALTAGDMPFHQARFRDVIAEQATVMWKNMDKSERTRLLNDRSEMLGREATANDVIDYIIENPPDNITKMAIHDANIATFRNKNALSDMAQGAKRASPEVLEAILEYHAPFVRTPTNIGLRMVDYSPVGFFLTVARNLKDFDQKAFVEGQGRVITGTAFIALGTALAEQGLMTGNLPESKAERELWKAAGKKPNSVFYRGQWRKLDRISPIGNLLTVGAEFHELGIDKTKMEQYIYTGFAGVKSVTEQSFLLGISKALQVLDEPERYVASYVENAVRSIVPNILGKVALGSDEFIRDANDFDLLQIAEGRIPILSENLPIDIDIFGRQRKSQKGVFGQLFDPFSSQQPSDDAVTKEFLNIRYNPTVPNRGFYTEQEYDDLLKLRGNMMVPVYFAMIDGVNSYGKDLDAQQKDMLANYETIYDSLGDDQKKAAFGSIDMHATRAAHDVMKWRAASRLRDELDASSESDREKTMKNIERRDGSLYQRIIYLQTVNNLTSAN